LSKTKSRRAVRGGNKKEAQMVSMIDALSEFDDFRRTILPALQKAVKSGKSSEEIAKIAASATMARAATMALTEEDPSRALGFMKEVLDRAHGKPGQKIEQTTKFENLSDTELDKILQGVVTSDEKELN
jgi:hypothetical protein